MSISAMRLTRRCFGPLSSTNTTRLSKKPFSPVTRANTLSEIRCAIRRALAASPLNCSPATCSPVATSHSRNRAVSLPPFLSTPPVSTNWALTVFQASRLGAASGSAGFSGKVEGLIGDRKIERAMSLAITAPILRGVAGERRHGDRHRLELAAGAHVDVAGGAAPARPKPRQAPGRGRQLLIFMLSALIPSSASGRNRPSSISTRGSIRRICRERGAGRSLSPLSAPLRHAAARPGRTAD